MFPYIRLFAPFRYYAAGLFLIAHCAYLMSYLTTVPTIQSNDPYTTIIVAHEDLLRQKADHVLQRFNTSHHTVDLCVSLERNTVTTTTFTPGHSIPGDRDTREFWTEQVNDSPRIRNIKVCVTLSKGDNIDQDELFRALSYSLGIELARGDMLRLVFL